MDILRSGGYMCNRGRTEEYGQMKHKLSCLIYMGCTCDFNDELQKSKDRLDKMKDLLQNLETYAEVNDRLFEDNRIDPEDVQFLRDVNSSDDWADATRIAKKALTPEVKFPTSDPTMSLLVDYNEDK